MKPSPFTYHRPTSIETTVALLAQFDDTKILAGGQSLMPMMNYRYVAPEHIIDINRVSELSGVKIRGDTIRIGAMTRQRELKEHPALAALCPLINSALEWVGHIATRNRGTVGGSLSHLDPAAELPAVFTALDATLEVQSLRGTRQIPMLRWAQGYMTPDLEEDELLCAISFTSPARGHGYGFHEFARRHGDFALAAAAACIELDSSGLVQKVAIALAGVDMVPVRLSAAEQSLVGQAPELDLINAAAACASAVAGLEDVHASASYRQRIAVVMTRRAITDAVARANQEQVA